MFLFRRRGDTNFDNVLLCSRVIIVFNSMGLLLLLLLQLRLLYLQYSA